MLRFGVVALVAILLTSGCIERFGDETIPSEESIKANLVRSNLQYLRDPSSRDLRGTLRRWEVDESRIPLASGEDLRVLEAIRQIEGRLGRKVFRLTTSQVVGALGRGIIVSYGTALDENERVSERACGNVSSKPQNVNWFGHINDKGEIHSVVYLNLDSQECEASLAIALHEFGHVLGLFEHFPGFDGDGEAWSEDAWLALEALYYNKIGRDEAHIVIDVKK